MKLKIKDHSNKFGTPSHPSPLDRIRTGSQSLSSIIAIWRINYLWTMLKLVKTIIISGKRERARELGITSDRSLSFEGNQSFPKSKSRHAAHTLKKPTKILTSAFPCLFFQKNPNIPSTTFNEWSFFFHTVRGFNDLSFSTRCNASDLSFTQDVSSCNGKLDRSWQLFDYLDGASISPACASAVRNPNKAVLTIDSKTSKVLTCTLYHPDLLELKN